MISKNNIEEPNWIDFYKDMNSFDSGQFEMIKSQIYFPIKKLDLIPQLQILNQE